MSQESSTTPNCGTRTKIKRNQLLENTSREPTKRRVNTGGYMREIRKFGSPTYLTGRELLVYEKVAPKLELKVNAVKQEGGKIVYVKTWIIEDELMSEPQPIEITSMGGSYRKQVISKCIHKFGFARRGKHSYCPLWVMEL
jgi:hypothetical protein